MDTDCPSYETHGGGPWMRPLLHDLLRLYDLWLLWVIHVESAFKLMWVQPWWRICYSWTMLGLCRILCQWLCLSSFMFCLSCWRVLRFGHYVLCCHVWDRTNRALRGLSPWNQLLQIVHLFRGPQLNRNSWIGYSSVSFQILRVTICRALQLPRWWKGLRDQRTNKAGDIIPIETRIAYSYESRLGQFQNLWAWWYRLLHDWHVTCWNPH